MNQKDKSYFIDKSNSIYAIRYDYSESIYINNSTKIKIRCLDHGYFTTTPNNHYQGTECKICKRFNKKKKHLIKANKVHNNKYDYSLCNFKSIDEHVDIICPEHGMFKQQLKNHIHLKTGCPSCYGNKKFTHQEIIDKANNVHNNKYDYSLILYKNIDSKVKIICPDHGHFKQSLFNHINNSQGCPGCSASQGERQVEKYLIENNISYIKEKKFKTCKNIRVLPFDFYLKDLNILIEYDGIQHFKPVDFFGGEMSFKLLRVNDLIKNNFCVKNNIKLIRIKYTDNIQTVLGGKL